MNIEYNKEFFQKIYKLVDLYARTFFNVSATGLENIPKNQTCLYAGNHLNIIDPYLIARYTNEELRYMVNVKLYRYKLWESFFKKLGTFPIDPKKLDLEALRIAINYLKEDQSIVIFPEGETHKLENRIPFKPGVARIAQMTKATLVPFGINGSYKIGSDLTINFGEPIDLSQYKKSEYDQVLEEKVRILEKK